MQLGERNFTGEFFIAKSLNQLISNICSMTKLNMVRYAPYNLKVYIDKRAARCPRKCDLLSEHFAGKQTDEQRQNIEIVWRSLETYEKAAAAVRSAAAARAATAAKETFESESSTTTTIIINKTKTVTATTTTTIAETAETIRTTETVTNANEATEIGGSAATAAAPESTTTATSEATNTDIFTKVVMDLTKAVTEKPEDNASSSTTTSSGIALQKAKASVAVNKAAPQASTAATKVAEEMANDLHLQSMNPALSKEVMVPTSALEAVEEFFTPVDKVDKTRLSIGMRANHNFKFHIPGAQHEIPALHKPRPQEHHLAHTLPSDLYGV